MAFDETHDSLLGHPPTLGGSKSVMPIPVPCPAMKRVRPGFPSAFAALSMYSTGDLMSERYAAGAVNSGLVRIARMSAFTLYPDVRNVWARDATYASLGDGET